MQAEIKKDEHGEEYEVIDGINVVRSMFQDDGEAYGQTQWDDRIKDGSLMIHRDGVIILCAAWPVIACGPEYSEFHRLRQDDSWEQNEGGKYLKSYELAKKVFERERQKDKEYEVFFDRPGQPYPNNKVRKTVTAKTEASAFASITNEYLDAENILVFKK